MAEFTVRYFFGDAASEADGQTVSYVSAGIVADDEDAAARKVRDQMKQDVFEIDSDGYGRVIINRVALRFCSILPAQTAEQSAAQVDAASAAEAQDDFAARAHAAGAVDREVRRF